MTDDDFIKGTKSCTLTNIKVSDTQSDLPISEFDLNSLVEHPAFIIIGKRGCGTIELVKQIISHQLTEEKIDQILIFSSTDKFQQSYSDICDNVLYKYDGNIIDDLICNQTKLLEKNIKNNVLIVFHDVFGQKGKWTADVNLQEILFNGRYYNISIILTMQFPIGLSPEIRSNFDYYFLFADDNISNKKRLYDHYAGIFDTFKIFEQVYKQLTNEKYCSMVLINKPDSKNIFEKVKWFKANSIENIEKINSFVPTKKEKKPTKKKIQNDNLDDGLSYSSVDENFIKNNFQKFQKGNLYMSSSTPNSKYTEHLYNTDHPFITDEYSNELTINPQHNMPNNMIPIQFEENYIKQNKNKYDVLYSIIECNKLILNNGMNVLNGDELQSILNTNLKIVEICGTNELQNEILDTFK